jgi:hypothetical protein
VISGALDILFEVVAVVQVLLRTISFDFEIVVLPCLGQCCGVSIVIRGFR